MSLIIEPIKGSFGAYITCQNVSALSSEEYKEIKLYLSKYALLIFKNQKMDDEVLVNFAKQIGSGKLEEPARKISLSDNRKYVAYLTNLRDSQGELLGFAGNDTDYWHSDQEFRVNPASVSILYGEVVQFSGGNTSFASTSVNHLAFTHDEVSVLSNLYSTRQPASSHDNVPHITVAHPVILENVQTKKRYVYVSENTIAFFRDEEILPNSDILKKSILDKILSPENIYSHQWEEGDLLLYDNSQLLHRRECFIGNRFIKGLKIYPDTSYQPEIPGWIVGGI
ncbi:MULTISPECIES: TauD/TfdA dioxygenase family protein [Xenorhabdus]|uniref:Alpha-ketoglutarate-dependent 2,4-dichlorophenoxyacetate dioxygenase n=1 Tax=Xenorhabdus ehlersii TaxID=290111 RepID=A0A2D0IRZ8_9GAMM|nr:MULTISPECIES: TauD/TfdA family dioxygenase [Xenorhabdus]MBC8949229.1 2,4-dichlorophenoxyacetate dioxygenase clavaminate synthase-like protein [Xenorhabdus sp. TS4]PHM24628.1 alpha-ketoglutarate-dependent 2,4-dichlorophenoxyacetate dioxygenase [Xenorhabdus ehlersii]RKE91266.1 taurine dioxygenase [Xenorhabdus ehlersii]